MAAAKKRRAGEGTLFTRTVKGIAYYVRQVRLPDGSLSKQLYGRTEAEVVAKGEELLKQATTAASDRQLVRKSVVLDAQALSTLATRRGTSESEALRYAVALALAWECTSNALATLAHVVTLHLPRTDSNGDLQH